ncbi:hypothetical protein [Actinosynnema sp. NPDC023587]|uniref:hypothetical protein n=1 Tax=Actinosynnema sp. NPDC023587 TaxID=3154695 RepID=UPI0033D782A4
MELPRHRALLGVDVIGSARNEGHDLEPVRAAVDGLVRDALTTAGIFRSDVVEWESTGDGVLITLPGRKLGAVLDSAHHLDELVEAHNRERRPDIRLRLAVETGPVGPHPGLYAPKISLCRLLNAASFKDLTARCTGMNTALILSDQAHGAVFGGDYTRHVRRTQFGPLDIREKEYAATAWVRIPGFDTRHPGPPVSTGTSAVPEPIGRISNVVHGSVHGVQAGIVYGGITLHHSPAP